MELLEWKDLKRRVLEGYSRDPRGWSFDISPSRSGFFDATVSGPNGAWLLKIDSLFKPYPIVIGSPTEPLVKRPEGLFPYGYRALPAELALRMMEGGGAGPGVDVRKGVLSVLRSEPVVPEAGLSYAEGPLVLRRGRVALSDGQREVDEALSAEMRRLLKLRYPAYG